MRRRVAVVDYGVGNLFSIARALAYLGAQADIASSPEAIQGAERLILPGVGAFGEGMEQLRARGLIDPIRRSVQSGCPLLGICLGMQLLFSEGEEFGLHTGLGMIGGRVTRLSERDPEGHRVKVPHVGWSELQRAPVNGQWSSTILRGLTEGDAMYFVHSYAPRPTSDSVSVAQITYGGSRYCAVVHHGRVTGCQFHPEKSGEAGLQILRNFVAG